MSLASVRLAVAAIAAAGMPHVTTQTRSPLLEGVVAPDFSCVDWRGAPLTWADFEGKPVLVFFHAPSLAYSARIFTELLTGLEKEEPTRAELEVLLVLNDAARAEELAQSLAELGIRGHVVADPERAAFAGFRVIAFPSAFCMTPDRRIACIVKGTGPIVSYRILLGCELACGLIDLDAYRELLGGGPPRAADPAALRSMRHLNLARSLLVAGRTGEALQPLLQAEAAADDDPTVLSALALVLIELDREADARERIERLATIAPEGSDIHLLRARLSIRAGDLDAARAELRRVDALAPEARLLRGLMLEAEGDWEAAARLHRRTVRSLLWRDRIPRRVGPGNSDPPRDE